ncbi:FKBP-type peptidyl-prolyl cis-trans isomerase [Larkinella insperata]|uniref:Peptidyl-prolyl cis-trans isomerase n=1 Tax=Larkinella insperata TaxID=332158 RepID=A0ABW3QCU9_9BACT
MKLRQFSAYLAMAFFLAISLMACKNNFEDPSEGAAENNDQQIRDYLNANQLLNRVTPTTTGLYYYFTDTTATRNKTAQYNEELEFTFTLSYIKGNQAIHVDSANQTKSSYIPFYRGVMVPGLEEGLLLMREGQGARFFMPSNLAFGQGIVDSLKNPVIPPYTPVIFNVQLKRSRTETEQMQDYATLKKLPTPVKVPVTGSTDSVWVYRLTQGTGPKVTAGQTVTVFYSASTLRRSAPFEQEARDVKTGDAQSTEIEGLLQGLPQLNVGDKALLLFASSLGYGAQGSNDQINYIVPPYSPLVYEVTVKSAKQ